MDIAKAIGDLYDYVTSGQGNKHRLLDIAVVNEELAAQIKNVTGCEVGGFAISVDNYGIKHTIRRHGSFDAEAKRGQVAVTKADFE